LVRPAGQDGIRYCSFPNNSDTPQGRFDGRPVFGGGNAWSELLLCDVHFPTLVDRMRRRRLCTGISLASRGEAMRSAAGHTGLIEVARRPDPLVLR
jgi:hypothetical protein